MKRLRCIVLAGFMLGGGSAGAAQSDPSPTPSPDIVVEGVRLDEVDRFVDTLTNARGDRQVARWNSRLCVGVMGAERRHAHYLIARIGQIARQQHIPVASKRCRPNILIVVTDEADRFATLTLERHPRLYGEHSERLRSPRRTAIWLSDRPIRWVSASVQGSVDGPPLQDDGSNLGQTNMVRNLSRISKTTRENRAGALILIDALKIQGLTSQQIADYVAMIALTSPATEASFGKPPTILSLFSPPEQSMERPTGLTSWDLAFLSALYRSGEGQSARAQRREISRRITRAKTGNASPDQGE